jgi:hypothetical protein
VVTSVQCSAFPNQSASAAAKAVRDEMVRAVMPELRVLLDHLVNTAVERSLGPLIDKQHELETTLKAVQAQLREAKNAVPAREVRSDARAAVPVAAPALMRPEAPHATHNPTLQTLPRATPAAATAPNTSTAVDIPDELNGSRRKRVVVVSFAIALIVLLSSVVGLSVLSNLGLHL